MGEVIRLSEARARRLARVRLAASLAPEHPALRWTTTADEYAHRRGHDARQAACGVTGPLTAAPVEARPCPRCYPGAG